MAKISFDFDGTLNDDFYGNPNPYKKNVQELAKKLIGEGHEVLIVTRRYGQENKNENKIVLNLAEQIGITPNNIYFTNRDWKFHKLNELNVDFHIDDDETDILNIKLYCNNTKGFLFNNLDDLKSFYKNCNNN